MTAFATRSPAGEGASAAKNDYLVADLSLDNQILKEVNSKKW